MVLISLPNGQQTTIPMRMARLPQAQTVPTCTTMLWSGNLWSIWCPGVALDGTPGMVGEVGTLVMDPVHNDWHIRREQTCGPKGAMGTSECQ